MPVTHDVFSLLRIYARYGKSPEIGYDAFRAFVDRYAKKYMAEQPELSRFLGNPDREIDARVRELSVAGRLSITCDRNDKITTINFPYVYVDIVAAEYIRLETQPETPFPCESSLHLKNIIPSDIMLSVPLETELYGMIENSPTIKQPLIRIGLPGEAGSLLILPRLIPTKLLEYSMQKIRFYIKSHNNKEYIQGKLLPAFPNKESKFKDTLALIMTRPSDAIVVLKKGGDFAFPFFAHLAGLVKSDLEKKGERSEEELSIYKAAYIVEFFNNFHKSKEQQLQRIDAAFKTLEALLKKTPYYYSINDILDFKDSNGALLIGQYTQEGLESRIKEMMSTSERSHLPNLLAFHVPDGARYYVLKENVFPLVLRLCGEVREDLRRHITADWFRLKSDYHAIEAMDDDDAFEADLHKRLEESNPVLGTLLDYKILALVFDELANDRKVTHGLEKLFYKGDLAPLSEILSLSRKNLLVDVKVMLPFWHSIPIIGAIMSFFRRRPVAEKKLAQKTTSKTIEAITDGEPSDAEYKKNADERKRYAEAMMKLERRIVPEGYDIEGYLEELNDRWNTLINAEAKQNLKADVDSVIRDYLRRYIRTLKARAPNEERLDEMTDTLVQSPSFAQIRSKEYFREYIKLYLYKLIVKSSSFNS